MRRSFVLALAVVLVALAGASSASFPLDLHPSVLVRGDGGFTSTLSGVREGSGTPADPYVISGWTIVHTASYAIRLQDTTAHVVIEDLHIDGRTARATRPAGCVMSFGSHPCPTAGIELLNASNVTIRDVDVPPLALGVAVYGSEDVRIDNVTVRADAAPVLPAWNIALDVIESARVDVWNASLDARLITFWIVDAQDVTLGGSLITGSGGTVANAARVALVNNTLRESMTILDSAVDHLTVAGNRFEGGDRQLVVDNLDSRVRDTVICGNTFTGARDTGLEFTRGERALIHGNVFTANHEAIDVYWSTDVQVEGNAFTGSTNRVGGLIASAESGERIVARNNSFDGNAGALVLKDGVDARHNWWASPDGPSGDGPGDGDAVLLRGAVVDPWLEAAPELTRGCLG